jgi:DNA repair protein RecO (recombination protein O)
MPQTRWQTDPVRVYRDEAVVVRQHKLGEADRIVTLLTKHNGLVRAVAKGVRRTRSKFGARLEPFAHVDVMLHPGRNLDIVTQVHSLDAFAAPIVADYGRYTSACAILETAERLAGEERAPVDRLHSLTVGALRAIADGRRPRDFVLDAFLLRAMDFAGWMPALDRCARCDAAGPHRAFHVAAGGAVCLHCRPQGSATPAPGVLELMDDLHRGRWEHTDGVAATVRRQTSGLTAAHLQWHLERQLRTLPLIEREAPHRAGKDDIDGGPTPIREAVG